MTIVRGTGGCVKVLSKPKMTRNPIRAIPRLREAIENIEVLEKALGDTREELGKQKQLRGDVVRIPPYDEGWEDRGGRVLKSFPEVELCAGDEVWVLSRGIKARKGSIANWWFHPREYQWWVTADHEVFLRVDEDDLHLYFDPDQTDD